MPLVRISLVKGKPEAYRRKVRDLVYDSMYLGIAREVAKENWSFGNGVASYAPPERVAA